VKRGIALTILLALVVLSALVLLRSDIGYAVQDRDYISSASSSRHWIGTDELGRDRLVRVAAALLLGLTGAVAASALATVIAVGVGVTAAFVHPVLGKVLMYIGDVFLTLPWLFLLMMVRSTMPLTIAPLRSAAITFLLLAVLGWPAYARVTYVGAVGIRKSAWVLQSRAAGLRTSQIAFRHVLPHLKPLLLSQFLIGVPACLIAEANLGTLGLGVSEPLPSWGSMLLALGNSAALANSHWVYLPVVLLVLVLYLLEMLIIEV
jgi:peptide/nickel transport system permease protein